MVSGFYLLCMFKLNLYLYIFMTMTIFVFHPFTLPNNNTYICMNERDADAFKMYIP